MSRRKSIVAISAALISAFILCSPLVPASGTSSVTPHGPGDAVTQILWAISDGVLGWLSLFSLPSWLYSGFRLEAATAFWPGDRNGCKFPLPSNLLTHRPVQHDHPDFQKAADTLHKYFSVRTSQPDIDSLAVAVVTPAGVVFEQGYGTLKANDTSSKQYLVDGNSIYRLASVSKVFTVLETLLLRERGVLDFDDPVEKYVPEFSPPDLSYGWANYLSDRNGPEGHHKKGSRVTLRQLASHTGGIGRDYPWIHMPKWPTAKDWPTISPERNSSFENVLGSINQFPSVNLPYSYPIYSNAGFDLLGLANVAANLKANNDYGSASQPKTHKELLKRDIFDAFGLNSSFYRVPQDEELRAHIAIPARNSEWADSILGDVDDSAGGQYSSLSDLTKIMHLLLSPKPPSKKYNFFPSLVREWLRPLHIWPDGTQAVGAPWEIDYLNFADTDFQQARVPIYWKLGNLPGYHSLIGLNPEYGYGIIILVTGTYSDTHELGLRALDILQPAFRKVLQGQVREAYVGEWEVTGGNMTGTAHVSLLYGQLFMTKLIVDDVDVLRAVQEAHIESIPFTRPVPLWTAGRIDEFRLVFGRNMPGCLPYWVSIDSGFTSRGASIDLVYWENGELVYPSAGVRFKRTDGRY